MALLCLGTAVRAQPPQAGSEGTYLVLVSYNAWRPTVEAYLEGFVGTLHAQGIPSRRIAVEYLDSDRLETPAQREGLRAFLLSKYASRKLAFLVVIQQPATDFFQQNLATLSPGAPVLIVQGQVHGALGDHPWISEAPRWDFAGTLGLGLRAFPGTKRILLVTGSGGDDRALLEKVRSQLAGQAGRAEIQDTLGLTYGEVLERVKHLPPDTLILPLYFNQDARGEFHLGTEVMEAVRGTANAPMLGYFEDVPPLGVCGSMNSLHEMGSTSARAALDIARGLRTLPSVRASIQPVPRLVADWNQLKAWKVDPGRLPPGTLILNRPKDIWGEYRGWVLGALAFLLAESLLILSLLLERRRRKWAMRSLKQTEERFRMITEQAPVPIIITRDARITYANPAMARAWGFRDPDSMLGAGLADFVAPEDLPRIEARSAARHLGMDLSSSTEFLGKRQDGSTFPVYSTVIHLMLPDGPAILSYLLDLTELKAAESARMQMEIKLQQSQKLEAIGRLASGVAHDVNNMISVVMGHCELLRSSVDPQASPRVLKHVNAIEGASERSKGIVAQLLAFSRKQAIQPQSLDLNLRIRGTLENLGPMLGRQIELRFTPGEGLLKVWMDPIQVDQVLLNLTVNARDAMPGGGVIEVSTRNLDCPLDLPAGDQREGPWVELSVRDQGTGMTKEVLDRVFEPFFTTKGEGKGTGLGLATVFGIVQQAGGSIGIESEPGRGTAFSILLPTGPRGASDTAGDTAQLKRG